MTSVLLATRLVAMQTSTVRRSRNGDKQKKKETYSRNFKYTAVMTPQAKKLRILSCLSLHAKAMLAILCHTFATFCNEQKLYEPRQQAHYHSHLLEIPHSWGLALNTWLAPSWMWSGLADLGWRFPAKTYPRHGSQKQGRKGLRRDVATVCQRYGHDHSAQIITYVYHATNCLRPSSLAVPACLLAIHRISRTEFFQRRIHSKEPEKKLCS